MSVDRGRLIAGEDLASPVRLDLPEGVVVVSSRPAPEREGGNEDAAAVLPLPGGGLVLAVADGCGGHAHGERASRRAVERLRRHVEAASPGGGRAAILDAFEEANRLLLEEGEGSATTLSVALVEAGVARPFHAGDSLVLVTGQRGRLKLATLAHAPVAYAVEAGLLDADEALHHDDRSVISNLVGSEDMRIEVGAPLALARRDSLLLSTDGLTDNLRTDEIVEAVRRGPPEAALDRLASFARRRMVDPQPGQPSHGDDCTVLLFRRA